MSKPESARQVLTYLTGTSRHPHIFNRLCISVASQSRSLLRLLNSS